MGRPPDALPHFLAVIRLRTAMLSHRVRCIAGGISLPSDIWLRSSRSRDGDSLMPSTSETAFMTAGLHLSFIDYFATGEGARLCIAVVGSAEKTERLLREKVSGYFYAGRVFPTARGDRSQTANRSQRAGCGRFRCA